MRDALIHRARLVVRERGSRNAQGEYELDEDESPWFRARLMQRGVSTKRRARAGGTDARVAGGYELLADVVTIATASRPAVAVKLNASSIVETDCELLGSPVLAMDGEPELLNDGVAVIGWMCFAVKSKDAA